MDPLLLTSIIGSTASLIQGAVRGGKAKRKLNEYNAAEKAIPEQDPMAIAALAGHRRQRRAYERGSDAMTQFATGQARDALAMTNSNIVNSGRGDVNSLLRSEEGFNRAVGTLGARASDKALAMRDMEGNMMNAMVGRKYNRELSRAQRLYAEYGVLREGANGATQAGFSFLPNLSQSYRNNGSELASNTGVSSKPALNGLFAEPGDVLTPYDPNTDSYDNVFSGSSYG